MAGFSITGALEAARGHLLPLGVVCMGLGIGLWFALPFEPRPWLYALVTAIGLLWLWRFWRGGLWASFLCALVLGFCMAGLRAHLVAAPVLRFAYYGPIEGRVVWIDRSASDALRLTLDQVVLGDRPPEDRPLRLRVSLQGRQDMEFRAGQHVMLTGRLLPPNGPAEPEGFDFRRMAYFDRIGAVGYSRTPVVLWAPASWGEEWISRLRSHLAQAVRQEIGGEAGAFAAGAVTGDRSGISRATVEALRDSSLSHILAISGMNMAFLCGFVFAFLRRGIALWPWLALRVQAKKLAALLSLCVAWFYLLLSGQNVATERAFIMIAVMMVAILLDRRAITLRSAAIAAGLQLLLRPEALMEAGFQMSFAATLALIAGFRAVEAYGFARGWPRIAAMLFTLCLSSLIGGLASGPYAAAHFNRFADYGLLANVLTVPAMGLLIMPMAALAALLAPFGLQGLPLWLMGLGARWTLFVAYWVAGLGGAVSAVVKPEPWVLGLFSLGGLWLILWPFRARWAGIFVMALSLIFWARTERPELLIEGEGQVAGLLLAQGRAVSQPKGGGFAVQNWLENDGDLAGQQKAAARQAFAGPAGARHAPYRGTEIVILRGKGAKERLAAACAQYDLVILAARAEERPEGCTLLDQSLLRRTGPIALSAKGLRFANESARLWQGAGPRPEDYRLFDSFLEKLNKSGSARPDGPAP